MKLSPDFKDLLTAFAAAGVRYLLVGGYAVSFHSRPRATKDIDLWIEGSEENRRRIVQALTEFGVPPGLLEQILAMGTEEIVYFGKAAPPGGSDSFPGGARFAAAFARRVDADWDGTPVTIIGKEELIHTKRVAGRAQDRRDLRGLEGARSGRSK